MNGNVITSRKEEYFHCAVQASTNTRSSIRISFCVRAVRDTLYREYDQVRIF